MGKLNSISAIIIGATGGFLALLAAFFIVVASQAFEQSAQASATLSSIEVKRRLLDAFECARTEMGHEGAAFGSAKGWDATPAQTVVATHDRCDALIREAVSALEKHNKNHPAIELAAFKADVARYRSGWRLLSILLHAPKAERKKSDFDDWSNIVVRLTDDMAILSKALTLQLSGPDALFREFLQVTDTLWEMRADAGNLRRLIADALQGSGASKEDIRRMDQLTGRIGGEWQNLRDQRELVNPPPALSKKLDEVNQRYFEKGGRWRADMIDQLADGQKPFISRSAILHASRKNVDSIGAAATTSLNIAAELAGQAARRARQDLQAKLVMMMLAMLAALCAGIYVLCRIVIPLETITREMLSVKDGKPLAKISYESRRDEIGQLARSLRHFRDTILAHREMEVELVRHQAARQVAEQSSQAKSSFLASMSHELRTPLNAILGFSEILANGLIKTDRQRVKDYAQSINSAGSHLLALVNDILDLSKAEAGKMELRVRPVALGDLIEECIRLVSGRAQSKAVALVVGNCASVVLEIDELKIKQVILNLLSNAIKFTGSGGRVSVEAYSDTQGDVSLVVADTGIGIPPEHLKSVFEPFHQVQSAYTRHHQGTGLGLAIVKKIVELHGGTIQIVSAPGQGTSICLTLPRAQTGVADQDRLARGT